MNAWPDVAVVIPTYNRSMMLRQAIESVIDQSYEGRIELVIVDDDSTDDTPKLLTEYSDRYGDPLGLRFVRTLHQTNQGQAVGRNLAIATITAPLVAFLDDDDLCVRDRIRKQVTAIQSDDEISLVHTSFRYIDQESRFTDNGPQRPENPCHGRCVCKLLEEFLIIFSTVMVRRTFLNAAALSESHGEAFDPRLTRSQDYDLCLRMARLGKLAYLPEVLVYYRLHGGNHAMSDRNLRRSFSYHCQVQLDFVRRWGRSIGLSEEDAIEAVRKFLLDRANSLYWQRKVELCCALCDLAEELRVADSRFAVLRTRAKRPLWLLRVKDWVDRLVARWVGR